MNYQWYPGHMTKARRMKQENIKLIDLIIEVVDARIPLSSRNPDIDELGKNKARMILLNKSDLSPVTTVDDIRKHLDKKISIRRIHLSLIHRISKTVGLQTVK